MSRAAERDDAEYFSDDDDSSLTLTMKFMLVLRAAFAINMKVSGTCETVAADPYRRHPFESVSYQYHTMPAQKSKKAELRLFNTLSKSVLYWTISKFLIMLRKSDPETA